MREEEKRIKIGFKESRDQGFKGKRIKDRLETGGKRIKDWKK
jgi:hypothetical protein